MESFCKSKKNMFLPVRDGIEEAVFRLQDFRKDMKCQDGFVDLFENCLRNRIVSRIGEARSSKKKNLVVVHEPPPPPVHSRTS